MMKVTLIRGLCLILFCCVFIWLLAVILEYNAELDALDYQLASYEIEKEYLLKNQKQAELETELLMNENSMNKLELQRYADSETALNGELEALNKEIDDFYTEILHYEFNYDGISVAEWDMVIDREMDRDLVVMLKTFVTAISEGDYELFLFVLPSDILAEENINRYNNLMGVFNTRGNNETVVKKIAMVGVDDMMYAEKRVSVDVVDADGSFWGFGAAVERDYSGKWVVYSLLN